MEQQNRLCCFSNSQRRGFFPAWLVHGAVINNDDEEEDGDVLHPSKAHFSALPWNGFGSLSGTFFTRIKENSPDFRWSLKSMGE